MNNIVPLQRIETLSQLQSKQGITTKNEIPFKSVFEDAVKNVIDTDKQVTQDVEMLVSGQSDDIAGLMINMNKAQMSISMLVQMRNRALESYTEILRTNL